MQQLRDLGVLVALDDFGSGYSSLGQLARLPVDILKIDRAFTANLDAVAGRAVMDGIVALARSLGLLTVAEGIEEMGQAAELATIGIDFAQGYLFSRAVPAEALTDRLPCAARRPGLSALPALPALRHSPVD
jgi:EAL domain-containing protein (putative c-di-GMP-specific phosphodiesterase class I)